MLVNFIIELVLLILVIAVHPIFLVLYIGYALAILVPGIGAGIRRLHDTRQVGLVPLDRPDSVRRRDHLARAVRSEGSAGGEPVRTATHRRGDDRHPTGLTAT